MDRLTVARSQYKEFFLKQLRKSRDKLKGEDLKKVSVTMAIIGRLLDT